MLKRIIAIAVIFICATVAWLVLGATIFQRTYDSDGSLADHVVANWGAPQNQTPPGSLNRTLTRLQFDTIFRF